MSIVGLSRRQSGVGITVSRGKWPSLSLEVRHTLRRLLVRSMTGPGVSPLTRLSLVVTQRAPRTDSAQTSVPISGLRLYTSSRPRSSSFFSL
jgi:hypothetical protein